MHEPSRLGSPPVHILKRKMEKVPTKHERLVKFIMMSSAHWAPMYASLCINHQTHRFCFSANVGIFTTTRFTLPLFHCFEYTFALFASHVQCPIVQLISGSCTLQPSDITARVLPLHPQYFKVTFRCFSICPKVHGSKVKPEWRSWYFGACVEFGFTLLVISNPPQIFQKPKSINLKYQRISFFRASMSDKHVALAVMFDVPAGEDYK